MRHIGIIFFLTSFWHSVYCLEPQWMARSLSCVGKCFIVRGKSSFPISVNTLIMSGDEVFTLEDGEAWLFLRNGDLLRLSPQTQIAAIAYTDKTLLWRHITGHWYLRNRDLNDKPSVNWETDSRFIPFKPIDNSAMDLEINKASYWIFSLGQLKIKNTSMHFYYEFGNNAYFSLYKNEDANLKILNQPHSKWQKLTNSHYSLKNKNLVLHSQKEKNIFMLMDIVLQNIKTLVNYQNKNTVKTVEIKSKEVDKILDGYQVEDYWNLKRLQAADTKPVIKTWMSYILPSFKSYTDFLSAAKNQDKSSKKINDQNTKYLIELKEGKGRWNPIDN